LTHDYDAIVLGLGGIGSAAAYWLARRGARVVGIEQFEFGHSKGSSHDHSRIIRLSYHAAVYVRFAKEAYAAWEALHDDSHERVVFETGGLDIGPLDSALSIERYADAMSACDVSFERLDATEIRKRFPAFEIADDVHALFQARSGIVAAEKATALHQRMAREHGAVLLDGTHVDSIAEKNGEITVLAGGRKYRAGQLVIAAGAWTNRALEHLGVHLPLEVTKEQAMYFRPSDARLFEFGRFPIWIWMDDPSFYGFPVFGEAGAVKITQDAGGKPVDAQTRDFSPDPEITARVQAFLAEHIPSVGAAPLLIKTCLYTLPPDRDFIIDSLPGRANVHLAVGAGHAFKFACVIGRVLTDLSLDAGTTTDISAFTLRRPILAMERPPRHYMF
jgi:sarcosine oxidase